MACGAPFTEPVLLPCLHALCRGCACAAQRPVHALLAEPAPGASGAAASHEQEPPDGGDSDKASVYSETDSGVVVASRPASCVPSPEASGACEGGEGGAGATQQGIRCPVCLKVSPLGAGGAAELPRHNAMARIIARVRGGEPPPAEAPPQATTTVSGGAATLPPCQLCEGPPRPAATECSQCRVLYCGPCLASCHPARGPLAAHTLGPVTPLEGPSGQWTGEVCAAHGERPTQYCLLCRWWGCNECGPRHGQQGGHDLQPLDNLAKTHKVRGDSCCVLCPAAGCVCAVWCGVPVVMCGVVWCACGV